MLRTLRACLVLAAALLASGAGHAGCSEVLSGRSSTHEVTINDGGCEFGKLMIGVEVLRSAKPQPAAVARSSAPGMVAFDSQCQWTPDGRAGFACGADGATVLAGATYRRVPGRKKVCGDPRWPVYQCTQGCSQPGVPRVLRIDPYEC
jgi:hypothetical protein